MNKGLLAIAIIDSRINELKAELRRRLIDGDVSTNETVHLVDKAADDINEAVARAFDRAEVVH